MLPMRIQTAVMIKYDLIQYVVPIDVFRSLTTKLAKSLSVTLCEQMSVLLVSVAILSHK